MRTLLVFLACVSYAVCTGYGNGNGGSRATSFGSSASSGAFRQNIGSSVGVGASNGGAGGYGGQQQQASAQQDERKQVGRRWNQGSAKAYLKSFENKEGSGSGSSGEVFKAFLKFLQDSQATSQQAFGGNIQGNTGGGYSFDRQLGSSVQAQPQQVAAQQRQNGYGQQQQQQVVQQQQQVVQQQQQGGYGGGNQGFARQQSNGGYGASFQQASNQGSRRGYN